MPRYVGFLNIGVLVCGFITTHAQGLPKNASHDQVMGYQLQQQKQWTVNQLPRNSVLYKSSHPYAPESAASIGPIKNKLPNIHLPDYNHVNNSKLTAALGDNGAKNEHALSVVGYLNHDMLQYNKWKKDSWWKDPQKGFGASFAKSVVQNKKTAY